MLLGEKVAIEFLEQRKETWPESVLSTLPSLIEKK
jgi:hypothetical protein